MKKHLLSILISFSSLAFSQGYNKMLRNSNEWHFVWNEYAVFMKANSAPGLMNATLFAANDIYADYDSIYNSNTYKMISQFPGPPTVTFYFDGLLREDTVSQKVWFIEAYDSTEVLLYDFSMNTGDSIFITFPYTTTQGFLTGWYYMDSIVTKNIFIGARKHFYLHNPANPLNSQSNNPNVLEWIESVGSPIHILYPYLGQYDMQGPFTWGCNLFYTSGLICKSSDSSRYYFDNCLYSEFPQQSCGPYDSCHYTICGGIETNSFIHSVTIFPQPATEKISLLFQSEKTEIIESELSDLRGKIVLPATSSFKIKEGENKIDLDISSLPAGFYFITLSSKDNSSVRLKFVKME